MLKIKVTRKTANISLIVISPSFVMCPYTARSERLHRS